MTVQVRQVHSKRDLEKPFAIRVRVFLREQGVPELDHDDARALHFLAFAASRPVGTARVVTQRGNAKIGRMAVIKSYRGRGIGKKLPKRAIATARNRGAQTIYLYAQVPVIGFYEGLGFRSVGPVFKEAGILHRKMTLTRP